MFYLGTHETCWLERTHIPLFVSRRRLARRVALPRACGPWALDSGGFSELSMFGEWRTSKEQYAEEVDRWSAVIGRLDFAAIQDWMCEDMMLAKIGKSVREHQELTIQSCLDLQALLPGAPWCPVLQGYSIDEYLAHAEMYASAGIDLKSFVRVGVGSVCRRQATFEIVDLFAELRGLGLKLHGFGLKTNFLKRAFGLGLASFDSMAWSLHARKRPALAGCPHKSCANCMRYALNWRDEICSIGKRPTQALLI